MSPTSPTSVQSTSKEGEIAEMTSKAEIFGCNQVAQIDQPHSFIEMEIQKNVILGLASHPHELSIFD